MPPRTFPIKLKSYPDWEAEGDDGGATRLAYCAPQSFVNARERHVTPSQFSKN